MSDVFIPPAEPIHNWFSLSYASWLTLPRSVLQTMPDEWQERLVTCLRELDAACHEHGVDIPDTRVHGTQRGDGAIIRDLSDYQRGRRRMW